MSVKVGDKYIVEIAEVQNYKTDEGLSFPLGRVKGFRALTLDGYALDKLERYTERDCRECQNEWITKLTERGEDAYAEGLAEGEKKWKDTYNTKSLTYEQGYKDGYEAGMNMAWECARKTFSDMPDYRVAEAYPYEWENGGWSAIARLSASEAIAKLHDWEEKQKQPDIQIGDEVIVPNGDKGILTGFVQIEDGAEPINNVMFGDGSANGFLRRYLKKTGRHFDVQSILDAMQMKPHRRNDDPEGDHCEHCKYDTKGLEKFPCNECCYGGAYRSNRNDSYYTKETE